MNYSRGKADSRAKHLMKTVLLIDDDAAFRALLTELIRGQGWNVLQAEDGKVGLEMTREHRPELIFCDLLMPRCNGYQFCRAIRQSKDEIRDTKIIVTSGSGYATDRMNALESGADEYYTKPIHAGVLHKILQKYGAELPPGPQPESMPTEEGARVTFWGVRGSVPSPGPETVFYGGNTSCVEVRADGEIIILDAGTGIRPLGQQLLKEFGDLPMKITLLVSHTHWDHIQGFPFFAPAYDPRNVVQVLAFEGPRKGLEATLAIQMESPFFPITMQQMPGNIRFEELQDNSFDVGKVKVKAAFMNHPGICVGYRLFTSGGSIAYFPDNELFNRLRGATASDDTVMFSQREEQKIEEFIRDADVVISDAQYDAEEYRAHVGWGHSCVDDVVELAMKAGVKELFLFHHDPDHDDQKIAQMLAHARSLVAAKGSQLKVEAARERMTVTLPAKKAG